MTARDATITVAGAGVLGLWQALALRRAGYAVRLVEETAEPFAKAASRYGGAMLAPDCEAESAPKIVRDQGRTAIAVWREVYPDVVTAGTLVVAAARDGAELTRFARLTERHESLDAARLGSIEPQLAGRFQNALHFPHEAHFAAGKALRFLLALARERGVEIAFGQRADPLAGGVLVDCRGIAKVGGVEFLHGRVSVGGA